MTEPKTSFVFLKCKDLQKDSDYTIGPFDTSAQQLDFFKKMYATGMLTLEDYSYQRVDLGRFEINESYEKMRNFDYMIFRNESHSSKTYFAFIDSVAYVSDDVCAINYTIDDMQTYFAVKSDISFKQVYVEREHTDDDNKVNVLSDQPVSGEYIINENKTIKTKFNTLVIVMQADETASLEDAPPIPSWKKFELDEPICNGVVNATRTYVYAIPFGNETIPAQTGEKLDYLNIDVYSYSDLVKALDELLVNVGKTNKVQSMYQAYIPLQNIQWANTRGIKYSENKGFLTSAKVEAFKNANDGESYKPVNNKAYTYPYMYDFVSNGESDLILRDEFFRETTKDSDGNLVYGGGVKNLDMFVCVYPQPTIGLAPKGYAGVPLGDIDYDHMSVISRQTNLAFSGLSKEEYRKVNGLDMTANIAKDIVGAVASLSGGGPQGLLGGAKTLVEGLLTMARMDAAPQPVRGATTPSTFVTAGDFGLNKLAITEDGYEITEVDPTDDQLFGNGFVYGRKMISGEEMKVIDHMWTVYGYPCRLFKYPNIDSRTRFNYVKTENCSINSSLPSSIKERICSKFDNGFTYWHPMYNEETGMYDVIVGWYDGANYNKQ